MRRIGWGGGSGCSWGGARQGGEYGRPVEVESRWPEGVALLLPKTEGVELLTSEQGVALLTSAPGGQLATAEEAAAATE